MLLYYYSPKEKTSAFSTNNFKVEMMIA